MQSRRDMVHLIAIHSSYDATISTIKGWNSCMDCEDIRLIKNSIEIVFMHVRVVG